MPKIGDKIADSIKILNLVYLKCLELLKYNIEHTIADYIELSVSVALTTGLGNKLITYLENDKFTKTKGLAGFTTEKFISVVEEYIGNVASTKVLLSKYGSLKNLKIVEKTNAMIAELEKLPKDLRNLEVISIFKTGGEVDDSGIIEIGGFLETPTLAYPTNLFHTAARLGDVDKKGKMIKKWTEHIESYFTPIREKIKEYLVKRAQHNGVPYDSKMNKGKSSGFEELLGLITQIKEQDRTILMENLEKYTPMGDDEIGKNMEIIRVLNLDPKRRSEVLDEIENSMNEFEKGYLDLGRKDKSDNIDELFIRTIENLNKFGYAIDYLLSKENKITCINNIHLVLKTYISLLEKQESVEEGERKKYDEDIDFLEKKIGITENFTPGDVEEIISNVLKN